MNDIIIICTVYYDNRYYEVDATEWVLRFWKDDVLKEYINIEDIYSVTYDPKQVSLLLRNMERVNLGTNGLADSRNLAYEVERLMLALSSQ